METPAAAAALCALGHEPRLNVFRLLVRAGPPGAAAGDVARAAGVLPSTLSSYLKDLAQAGLVTSRRAGRSVIYSADYARVAELLDYLLADCCEGDPGAFCPVLEKMGRGPSGGG
jgi:ArsR family transcriptional regulator